MTDVIGSMGLGDMASPFASLQFLARQMLAEGAFAGLGLVVAVNPAGTGKLGTVSVQPMVHQIDGAGKVVPHGTIFEAPYFRLQGGVNAVIIDPAVGDIGILIFADRDISNVAATQKPAPPGSRRQHAWADALYVGGLLNGNPTQYVEFLPNGGGIGLISPQNVTIKAPNIDLIGSVAVTGGITDNGVDIGSTHVHGGVTTGGGTTAGPQ